MDLGLELLEIFNLCLKQLRITIDYNNNKVIELKNIEDSFASLANYLKKIGWKKYTCFSKIELKDNIPKKYLNSSAKYT